MEVLKQARKKNQGALSEYDSKRVLKKYGIPVTKERLVKSQKDAVAAADKIGYPVVIKACGADLTHKTEHDAIRLNLADAGSVRKAVKELKEATEGLELEGFLVQQMVMGQRELVMGLIRDPQFGPCVMFGLGGIYTEILKDVSFRVAPLTQKDALEQMSEIRGKKILEAFRGMAAVDKKALAKSLVALGKIGMDHDDIAEIDINPLILTKKGKPVAVDALVVLDKKE